MRELQLGTTRLLKQGAASLANKIKTAASQKSKLNFADALKVLCLKMMVQSFSKFAFCIVTGSENSNLIRPILKSIRVSHEIPKIMGDGT